MGGGLGLPDFSSSILKGIRSGSYGWETGVFLLVPLKGVISNMWVPSSVMWVPSSALVTRHASRIFWEKYLSSTIVVGYDRIL